MILNDSDLFELHWREKDPTFNIQHDKREFIIPFVDHQVSDGVVSYGLSSFGYDARLGTKIRRLFKNMDGVLDPKQSVEHFFNEEEHEKHFTIKPGEFVLGHTVEYFKMPRDVMAVCLGKSTYARLGLIVNVTPLEPSWEGQVTLELQNPTYKPIRVYTNEGICQFVFFQSRNGCLTTYADRKGKYQGQKGVTLAKVKSSE